MKRTSCLILGLLVAVGAAMLAVPQSAQALNAEVEINLPAGALAVTNDFTFSRDGEPVDYVVVRNTSDYSNTVTVTAIDGAQQTAPPYALAVSLGTLYSGTVLSDGTASVYPRRNEIAQTVLRSVYVVTNNVPLAVVETEQITNSLPYQVHQFRVIVTPASGTTNAAEAATSIILQSRCRP